MRIVDVKKTYFTTFLSSLFSFISHSFIYFFSYFCAIFNLWNSWVRYENCFLSFPKLSFYFTLHSFYTHFSNVSMQFKSMKNAINPNLCWKWTNIEIKFTTQFDDCKLKLLVGKKNWIGHLQYSEVFFIYQIIA